MAIYRPQAVLFDTNETLFDLTPLRPRFEEAGLPAQALELWFARVLRDGIAAAAAGTFAAFPELAAYHLRDLLGVRPGARDARVDRILDALRDLPPQPDVAGAIERLRRAGIRRATLTNGTVELATGWLERSGLLPHFEQVLDVSETMAWKPRAAAYVGAAKKLRVDVEHVALVSAHPWDIHGATCAGMMGAWVDRQGREYPEVMNPPNVTGRTLEELAGKLLDLPEW
jgi:2-haloacid dehalogenase